MKTLLITMIALTLTGCAGQGQKFMNSFGEGLEQQSRMRQQPQVYPAVTTKQTDYQCFQSCTQAGYQYGLCQSKCSY